MKAKKLTTTFLVGLLTIALLLTPVLANARPIDTVERRYEDEMVFVPLRLTAYAYGATVVWDGPNQTVYVTSAHGDTWPVVVAQVGGFIDNGTVWVPYEYAISVFGLVPVVGEPEAYQPETDTPEVTEPEAGTPQAGSGVHGLITRVTYGDNVAYVFGTMHAGVPELFPLNPIVEDAMSRTDVFVMEMNFAEEPTEEFMETMASFMTLPEGTTLEDVLPQDIFDNLIASLATFPTVAYEDIATLTPVAAWSHIINVEIAPLLGIDSAYSVDLYVFQYAVRNGREIVSLGDSFREMMAVWNVDMDVQATALQIFTDWQTTVETFTNPEIDMVLAYKTADLDLMAAAMIIEMDLTTAFGQHVFDMSLMYRNNMFTTEIARLLQETEAPTTFFVAVGIGHIMGGDFGQILVVLEEMGFDVQPLWK